MILMQEGIIDLTDQTADFLWLRVVVDKGSDVYNLEVEFFDVLRRICERINPALVVHMKEGGNG